MLHDCIAAAKESMAYHHYICTPRACCFPKGPLLLALMLLVRGRELELGEREKEVHAMLCYCGFHA